MQKQIYNIYCAKCKWRMAISNGTEYCCGYILLNDKPKNQRRRPCKYNPGEPCDIYEEGKLQWIKKDAYGNFFEMIGETLKEIDDMHREEGIDAISEADCEEIEMEY